MENKSFLSLFTFLFMGLLSACGGTVSFKDRGIPNNGNGLEEGTSAFNFNETLFPLLDQHCSTCHGGLQSPLIAISDEVITSHDNLIGAGLIDFQSPTNSRIVLKVKGNHNCWTADCNSDGEEIKTRIADWAARNGSSGGGDTTKPKTQELLIPSNIPTAPGTPFYVSFPLDGISGIPSNSFIDVAVYEIDGTAYVFGPVGIRSSIQLFVKKIDLQINKRFTTPTYHTVNALTQINTGAAPGFVVSSATPIVPVSSGKGVDMLRLVFDEIRPATQQEISNFVQAQRFADMLGRFAPATCGSCHFSTINYNGYTIPAFQTFTSPDQFKNIQQGTYPSGAPRYFVDPGNPAESSLYRAVSETLGGNNYPDIARPMPISGAQQATANAVQAWILNEPD